VLLPAGGLHDDLNHRALRLAQQTDDVSCLETLPAFAAVIPFAALPLRAGKLFVLWNFPDSPSWSHSYAATS
jgi:hypothetical protein